MQYQVIVDGKREKVDIMMNDYSLEADNLAREQIIRHYLDEEGAHEVVIEKTILKRSGICEDNKTLQNCCRHVLIRYIKK